MWTEPASFSENMCYCVSLQTVPCLTEEIKAFSHFFKPQLHLQILLPTASAASSTQIQVLSFMYNT